MAGDDFWDRLDRTGDCWLWTGATDPNGYGMVKVAGRSWKVHRYAWYLAEAREPRPGAAITQTCGHSTCCRPDHLVERPSPTQTPATERRRIGG